MKLSEYTKKVLGNIADINGSLIITPTFKDSNGDDIEGTLVKAVNKEKAMQLLAVIPEKFVTPVYLYDLKSFLSALTALSNDVEVEFGENTAVLRDKDSSVVMGYTSPELIIHEERIIKLKDEPSVTFEIAEKQLGTLLKFADILGLPYLRLFKNKKGQLVFQATDITNKSSNTYDLVVADDVDDFEEIVVKREMINIIPGDYKIDVTAKILQFTHAVNKGLIYMIGTNKKTS